MRPSLRRRTALIGGLLVAALAAAGCASSAASESAGTPSTAGSSGSSAAGSAASSAGSSAADGGFDSSPDQARIVSTKVDAIAAKVPQAIRDRGTLVVTGTAGTTPPLSYYATDDTTVIGVEPDIAYLVASVLGLKVEQRVADWAQNFVQIDSGSADVFISNVTVTEERKEKYDFATYRLDNVSFEAKKGSGWTVKEPKDVAGKIIAVSSGTNQEKLLVDWSAENVANGLAPTDIKYFQNASDYYLALASGRIDTYFGPNPTAQFHVAITPENEVIGEFSGAGADLQGKIAVLTQKDNGLIEAVAEALNHTISDGTYAQVLARWNLTSEGVTESEINPQGLPKTAG